MAENNFEEVRRMIRKAKEEDEQSRKATDIVNDAISEMTPQRNTKDKSQNQH